MQLKGLQTFHLLKCQLNLNEIHGKTDLSESIKQLVSALHWSETSRRKIGKKCGLDNSYFLQDQNSNAHDLTEKMRKFRHILI